MIMVQEGMTGMTVIVAIIFDSGSQGNPALRGRTAALAQAIARGAASVDGTVVKLIPVQEHAPHWDELDEATAIIFGCPTYMGSGSAAFKAFMEETFYTRWRNQQWKDKLAAGFTNSAGMSGDKLLTLQQLVVFAAQHGMIWVTLGEFPGWTSNRESAEDVNRLASFLGLMAQSNSDQGPDLAPPASDRTTAERFGRRISQIAHRWARP
jgi:NAD(P)H dehydrogenase (quinone)